MGTNRSDSVKLQDLASLRREAEAKSARVRRGLPHMSLSEVGDLLHDLETHKIELEMQNEELRRSQQELIASQQRYADLYDRAPVGYLTLSNKGLIEEANLRASEMLHIDRIALFKQPLSQHISEQDSDEWYRHIRGVLNTKERQAIEVRLRHRQAGECWCLVESILVGDIVSGESHVRTTLTDITVRKNAELQRAEALSRAKALLQASNAVLTSPDFESAARAVFGEAKSALGAQAGLVALVSKDGSAHEVLFSDSGGAPCNVDPASPIQLRGLAAALERPGDPMVRNDFGASKWARELPAGYPALRNLLIAPLVCDGNVVGRIVLGNKPGGFSEGDRQFSAGFAHLVAIAWQQQQARELERRLQADLHQSQKLEAIGLLAGGVAHDINNVLATIMCYASLALGSAVPKSVQAQDLKTISDSCYRARDFTTNLLGFARKGKYDPRVLSVETVITDLKALLERTIPKTIEIKLQLEQPMPAVQADRSQLQTALLNICANAADAMSEEPGVLTIAARGVDMRQGEPERSSDAGWYLLLEVRDTGVGMDRDTLARAMEPFFTTKAKGRGTGLGLSMAHGTISNHGGTMEIESDPGEGTTVRLYLPAAQGYASDTREARAAAQIAPVRGTVLLVDDEPALVSAGKRVLEALGCEVLTAADGREALDVYGESRDRVGLVILDLNMPRLDGVATFKALREMDSDVRVLIATGYEEDARTASLLATGACGLLRKPFEPDTLAEEVRRLLEAEGRSS